MHVIHVIIVCIFSGLELFLHMGSMLSRWMGLGNLLLKDYQSAPIVFLLQPL